MKKFLSIILSLVMIFAMSIPAFAADRTTNEIEYLTVYDEQNNTVQAIQRNTVTGKCVYGPLISVGVDTDTPERSGQSITRASKIHQDTFLNFEYDIWQTNPREWNLERPNGIWDQYYFKVYENSSNSSELDNWKDDVDALNAQEFVVIGAIGVSAYEIVKAAIFSHAAIASGGVLTAAAIDSIKSAVVATGTTGVAIGLLCTTYNNCAMSYEDVKRATNNIHY